MTEQQYDSAGDPVVITPPAAARGAGAGAGRRRLHLSRRWLFERSALSGARAAASTTPKPISSSSTQQYYDNRGYAPAPQGYYYQPRQTYQPRGLFTYQD